jgi:hypothetical protein
MTWHNMNMARLFLVESLNLLLQGTINKQTYHSCFCIHLARLDVFHTIAFLPENACHHNYLLLEVEGVVTAWNAVQR